MKTQESLQQCLFQTSNLLYALTDAEGKIKDVNKAFCSQFKLGAKQELIGKALHELPIWLQCQAMIQQKVSTAHSGGPLSCTQVLKTHAGFHTYYISFRSCTEGILLEMRDVEEVENSREEVAKARLSATEQRRSVEELAYSISHDLRAPVANMAYLMSLLSKGDIANSELQPFMEALQTSAHRTLEAIDGLGAKMNVDLRERQDARIPMKMIIDSVLVNYKDIIERSGASIKVEIEGYQMCNVHKAAFKMIFSQLISNSLKFRKPGVPPKIVINCQPGSDERIVTITDNGIGFDARENQDRLFGLFQTFHKHPEARGVGLFQVKNRLQSIGGGISLESQEGVGTTVTLNFKKHELEEASLHH